MLAPLEEPYNDDAWREISGDCAALVLCRALKFFFTVPQAVSNLRAIVDKYIRKHGGGYSAGESDGCT